MSKYAILGWGSLLWENRVEFESSLEEGDWSKDGPFIPLEFSRISKSRDGALTLVIDFVNGTECQVSWRLSSRKSLEDVICDLRCREGTTLANIGYYDRRSKNFHSARSDLLKIFEPWCDKQDLDAVVWTDLASNFKNETKSSYTVSEAIAYLKKIMEDGNKKAKAFEYISKAPEFIKTTLRDRLKDEDWFKA